MAGSKGLYIRKAVCHLTANRIVVFKTGILRFPFIYFFHDLTEPVQRLCRLGEKTNITAEIKRSRSSIFSTTMAVPSVWPTRPFTSACPFYHKSPAVYYFHASLDNIYVSSVATGARPDTLHRRSLSHSALQSRR